MLICKCCQTYDNCTIFFPTCDPRPHPRWIPQNPTCRIPEAVSKLKTCRTLRVWDNQLLKETDSTECWLLGCKSKISIKKSHVQRLVLRWQQVGQDKHSQDKAFLLWAGLLQSTNASTSTTTRSDHYDEGIVQKRWFITVTEDVLITELKRQCLQPCVC